MTYSLEKQKEQAEKALEKAKIKHKQISNRIKTTTYKKEREIRNREIYKLGGIVEKMGLDTLPENYLIAGLLHLHSLDKEKWEKLLTYSKHFEADGKRKSKIDLSRIA